MAKVPTYDPMTSDARSSWLAGLTEACNKLSGTLNMKTSTFENIEMPELYISQNDRFRIYQIPFGYKLWVSNPEPVIKKNGTVITPANDHFTVDYLGGSIAFEDGYILQAGDVITASATYIVEGSAAINDLIEQVSEIATEAGRNKGSFDSLTSLQTAYPTATAGDIAVVTDEDTIYVWDAESNAWVNVHKDVDLSAYYTSAQVDNKLSSKENSISAHGNTADSDNYYYGGRKTWINLLTKIRNFALTGLVTSDNSVVTAADTLLVAVGKLQAQISGFEPYIKGTSAPTTSTVGKIGQDYINTSNGDKYHLVKIEGTTYTWEKYGAGDVMQADLVDGTVELPYVNKSGDTMSGSLNVTTPTSDSSDGVLSLSSNKITFNKQNAQTRADNPTEGGVSVVPSSSISTDKIGNLKILPGGLYTDFGNKRVTGLAAGTNNNDAATIAQLTARIEALEAQLTPLITAAQETADNAQSVASNALPKTGGTMSSNATIEFQLNSRIRDFAGGRYPTFTASAGTDSNPYFSFTDAGNKSNPTRLQGIATPQYDSDAANKQYVDSKAGGLNPGTINQAWASISSSYLNIAIISTYCKLILLIIQVGSYSYVPISMFMKSGETKEAKAIQIGSNQSVNITIQFVNNTLRVKTNGNPINIGLYIQELY